jgi:glucose-1-phosphate thymidylyltransferase
MKKWKGIVLSGGSGSRLYPLTVGVSKQLLPIYDKPMIYYSLSVLMLAGIRDILIITTAESQDSHKKLLGDGSNFGINIEYKVQDKPNGLAEAFILGEAFIGDCNVCLVLGDNLFYGQGFVEFLNQAKSRDSGATIFGYQVSDPERFGVVEFDDKKQVLSIEEKPENPKSNYAVTGLYFYDNQVVNFAKKINPSSRGEIEITAINQIYMESNQLFVEDFGRGFVWFDTGTHDSLMEAGNLVQAIEHRQGLKISCLEEIGFNNGWISKEKLKYLISSLSKNSYSSFLESLIDDM